MTGSPLSDAPLSIVAQLLDHGAITVNVHDRYTFASGLRSPVYTDTRSLISRVAARRRVVAALADAVRDSFGPCGAIAGVVTAGVPWSAWLADEFDLPMVYVRSAPKNRGLGRQVEGRIEDLDRAIVVEDLVTTGSSSVNAVDALRRSGVSVAGVVSIFSYELPYAARLFDSVNVNHKSVATLSGLLDLAEVAFGARVAERLREWRDQELPSFVPVTSGHS